MSLGDSLSFLTEGKHLTLTLNNAFSTRLDQPTHEAHKKCQTKITEQFCDKSVRYQFHDSGASQLGPH